MSQADQSPADVYRAYVAAERAGDKAAMQRLLDRGITVELNGRAAFESAAADEAAVTVLFDAYPDYHREIIEIIEQGSIAAARWRMVGHPRVNLRDRLDDLDIAGCSLVEVQQGRISRAHVWSPSGVLEEILALVRE